MRPLRLACTLGFIVLGATVVAQDVRARPSLIVLISIDQFRSDYIDRFGANWTRGLRRLLDRGAYFSQAMYPYMNTVTCAGHGTISTGTFPSTHGMPLNAWWDRETGAQVTCTEDSSARNLAYGSRPARGGDSAWRLRVPTFSDELRLQLNVPPRIVAISLKGRSAITLGGHRADLVTWLDGDRGFVTSSAYSAKPVPFLQNFLATNPLEADAERVWTPSLRSDAYQFKDDAQGERPPQGWRRTFPHALPASAGKDSGAFHSLWEATPFADAYLARMAVAALKEFRMGHGPGVDFLAVSFSTLDMVGHAFGPRSHEVQDVLAQLDGTIDRLLDETDRLVGRDRYVVAMSGDHGVSPIPEQVVEEGVDAGRISASSLSARIDSALEPFLGAGPHVASIIYTELYFQPGVYAKLLAQPRAMAAVVEAIENTPGVLRVLRDQELTANPAGVDGISRTAIYSYVPGRSGDMLIIPRPYYLNSSAAATHGTGYSYDARVPVLLMGMGIKPGEQTTAASPADIAPTLAYLVGITMPRTDGRVLREALMPQPDVTATKPTAAIPNRESNRTKPR